MGIEQIVVSVKERAQGTALGLVVGGVVGILETAVFPSYAVSQITRDERYPAYRAEWPGDDFPNGTREYIRTGMVAREIVRLGIIFSMGIDFADGKADNLGYLAIPMAVSALYEMYRKARKGEE